MNAPASRLNMPSGRNGRCALATQTFSTRSAISRGEKASNPYRPLMAALLSKTGVLGSLRQPARPLGGDHAGIDPGPVQAAEQAGVLDFHAAIHHRVQIGRASCRERV